MATPPPEVAPPGIIVPEHLRSEPHLVGELSHDGIASLRKDDSQGRGNFFRPMLTPRNSSDSSSTNSTQDFGKLKIDPQSVVEGSKGSGVEGKASLPTPGGRSGQAKSHPLETTSRPPARRQRSITVKLERTRQAGKYHLSLEDPELRALLKEGFERSNEGEIKKKRSKFSDLVFTRQFTAFDRQNPTSAASTFHGFFTLFWISVALMLVKIAANNWREYGSILGRNRMLNLMTRRDLLVLGLSDGVLCGSTVFCLILQKLVARNYLSWNRSGWILQNLWQTFYIAATLYWTQYRRWPWTHSVFLVLHCIAMLMKQHSYAFYNGHLSELHKRRNVLEGKLKQLEDPEVLSPSEDVTSTSQATSYLDAKDLKRLSRRRKSLHATPQDSVDVDKEILNVASAIESDAQLDFAQVRSLRKLINWEIETLNDELKGACTVTPNYYPRNLNVKDFSVYIPMPTVVYELEYPRQEKRNWSYIAEKSAATFGVIMCMIMVSEHYCYPVVVEVVRKKEAGVPTWERLQEFPWVFMDLLFPFMLEYIFSWYVIWECVLNTLAELTLFADRGFYSDWWNATDWSQFARDWNTPVHSFLLRFAYHSSISAFHLKRGPATLVTFFLSACVHELVMAVIFGKIRGYLLLLQMCQLPLVAMTRSRWLKGRDVVNNAVFWFGIFVGPSFLCSLYIFL